MKLTLIEAVAASEAVYKIRNNFSLTFAVRKQLWDLQEELLKHVKFFSDEENKLVDKYGDKDTEGNLKRQDNTFSIADPTQRAQFLKEKNDLCILEVSLENFNMIEIPEQKFLESTVEFTAMDEIAITKIIKQV